MSRRLLEGIKVNKPGNRIGVLMASVLVVSVIAGCALTILQEYRLYEFCSYRYDKNNPVNRDYTDNVMLFCKPEPSSFEFSTYQSLNSANQSSLLKSLARISGVPVASNMFDLKEAAERHSATQQGLTKTELYSRAWYEAIKQETDLAGNVYRIDFIWFCSALAAIIGLLAYIIGLLFGWALLGAQRQT